jgi:hypothetical protein
MSKTLRSFLLVFAALFLILHLFSNSRAQEIEAALTVDPRSPTVVRVQGRYLRAGAAAARRNLSFLLSYGGISGLGERISDVTLTDEKGIAVPYRKFIAGEYVASGEFTNWDYLIDLKPPGQPSAWAHISWINGEIGLLMLDDLLPRPGAGVAGARITLSLPTGWKIHSPSIMNADGSFVVDVTEKAAFIIGRQWRKKEVLLKAAELKIFIAGEWQFSDDDPAKLAAQIFDEYAEMLGPPPKRSVQIAMLKFPVNVPVGNWEADTRGTSITIASSDTAFKSQSLQRLHEQLRHEIFHLWIPNGINLSGHYDWFYEGFALYHSLKFAVAVNRIGFEDYLDTLSRAYDIDRFGARKLSLIEASGDRWSGTSDTQVYARGMLVAFICDLALLERSNGKRSVTDLLRELTDRHRPPGNMQDGNDVVLRALRSHTELAPIIENNITGTGAINWEPLLKAAGLEADSGNGSTKLRTTARPSGRQKDLLNRLGYNNWRKLSKSNK